jgi:methylenetetrahydrofolate dehydrogenase (NADP+) / methenyltetrahydrofolate cyclohydrolase
MESSSRGRSLARAQIHELTADAARVRDEIGRKPVLAILAWDDQAGRKFVRIKQDALAAVDIEIRVSWLPESAETPAALQVLADLNAAPNVDGIFLQFPLPPGVDAHAASNAIVLDKDIDCSSDAAMLELSAGTSRYVPAAPAAARDLLLDELRSLRGWNVVLVGDDHFTRALDLLLMDDGARVETVSPEDSGCGGVLRDADAIVVTEALPHAATHRHIMRLPVLLDAGYYLPPRAPDFIPDSMRRRVAVHLTQYGSVGPLTVAHLAKWTIRAAEPRVTAG